MTGAHQIPAGLVELNYVSIILLDIENSVGA
jgi:hypothetical protein